MNPIGLLVVVYVTAGNVPGVELVAHNYMPLSECQAKAADLNATSDPETIYKGAPVVMKRYACTVQMADDVAAQATALK